MSEEQDRRDLNRAYRILLSDPRMEPLALLLVRDLLAPGDTVHGSAGNGSASYIETTARMLAKRQVAEAHFQKFYTLEPHKAVELHAKYLGGTAWRSRLPKEPETADQAA